MLLRRKGQPDHTQATTRSKIRIKLRQRNAGVAVPDPATTARIMDAFVHEVGVLLANSAQADRERKYQPKPKLRLRHRPGSQRIKPEFVQRRVK